MYYAYATRFLCMHAYIPIQTYSPTPTLRYPLVCQLYVVVSYLPASGPCLLSMNDSAGNDTLSSSTVNHAVVITAANSVSVLVCLLATILVFVFRLYKIVVYRLALYQVMASLALAMVTALQIVFVHACSAAGYLELHLRWSKLLFMMWAAIHLFCFAVLHKNMKKFEVLYVATSLLVPAFIAAVPIITHTYRLSPDGAVCYIFGSDKAAYTESFVLWDVPAMLILIAASAAMVVMVIKLASQVLRMRTNHGLITDGDKFWKALKQLLPLAAFPILFFIFEIPVLIFHIQLSHPSEAVILTANIFFALWSMTSGATLILHISVAKMCGRRRRIDNNVAMQENASANRLGETCSSPNSTTQYSLPAASV